MAAISGRDEPISEEMIDATLADSFPASDPPSWTLGREGYQEKSQPPQPSKQQKQKPRRSLL